MRKLSLNWRHVYEVEGITGVAEIKGGIKEFLQHFTATAATSTEQLLQPDYLMLRSHDSITKPKSMRQEGGISLSDTIH